jgi:hypothetical protein
VSATATPGVWDKALPTLARAARLPAAQAAAGYVGEWLATLAAHPDLAGQFDRELDDYAADLRRAGVLVGDQGAGFLLALWSRLNVRGPLQGELVKQVDRRAALRGLRHCPWRGTVPAGQFDAWRLDRARERSALKNKGER